MGINGTRADIIDKIIQINRQTKNKILPKKITSDLYEWKEEFEEHDMFVDFETIPDIFGENCDIIFLIGVYWFNPANDVFEYKSFLCNSLSLEEEYRIMDEFSRFVHLYNNPRLWHWSRAEKLMWNRREDKHFEYFSKKGKKRNNIRENWGNKDWCDLSEIFISEPIVVKDCFNYRLKSLVKAMKKHGFIKTEFDTNCKSGLDASVRAYSYYQKNSGIREIQGIRYNEGYYNI